MQDSSRSKRHRAPVDVFRYRDYRAFLAAYYELKKATGMSYRRFSAAVGLGAPNYLKLVIEGKRNLSPTMAERFATACKLSGESAQYFTQLVAFNQATTDEERNARHAELVQFTRFRQAQPLDIAEREYHATWYIPAIRELVACPQFQDDAQWIAQALKPSISEAQASHALEVLLRLNLVERDARGQLQLAARAVSTGQQASGLYIRNYHAEMMQRAASAMQEIPAAERFISSLTLSTSAQTLEEVRRRVIEFRKELIELCDADASPNQVIQLNLQLFPLTRVLAACGESLPSPARRGRRICVVDSPLK